MFQREQDISNFLAEQNEFLAEPGDQRLASVLVTWVTWKQWDGGFGGIHEEIAQYKDNLLRLKGITISQMNREARSIKTIVQPSDSRGGVLW